MKALKKNKCSEERYAKQKLESLFVLTLKILICLRATFDKMVIKKLIQRDEEKNWKDYRIINESRNWEDKTTIGFQERDY